MRASVTDPTHTGEGVNQHTKYKVTTPQNSVVERRYKEFDWVSARMQKTVKGVIIPPLPPKALMGENK